MTAWFRRIRVVSEHIRILVDPGGPILQHLLVLIHGSSLERDGRRDAVYIETRRLETAAPKDELVARKERDSMAS